MKRRMTKQRKLILKTLQGSRLHPTAEKIHQLVKKTIPDLSLGTVYRNLEVLQQQGLVQKLEMAHFPSCYDANTDEHLHARCTRCGLVIDLDIDPDELFNMKPHEISTEKDFKIVSYNLEFFGLCSRCLRDSGDKNSR